MTADPLEPHPVNLDNPTDNPKTRNQNTTNNVSDNPPTVKKSNTKPSKKRTPKQANGGVKKIDSQDIGKALEPGEWPEIEDARKRALLIGLRETGTVSGGCACAGASRQSFYTWRENDPAFAAAVVEVEEAAADRLEQEAYRRAVEGVTEPTGWYKGQPGGMIQRYSDTLAIFLLKGLRPEKYADRMEVRGALANLDLKLLPDALIERIANGEDILQVLASAAAEQVQHLLTDGDADQGYEITVESDDSDDDSEGSSLT